MILNAVALIVLLPICVGLLKLVLFYIYSYRILLKSKIFRGPKTLPLVGNAHSFMGDTADMFSALEQFTNTYPSPFRFWLGPKLFFGMYDPDQIKLLLTNPDAYDKDSLYKPVASWGGEGLVTAPAAIWKIHRKLIEPTFSTKVLESFIKVFQEKSGVLVEKLETKQEEEIDIADYMSRYSLEAICGTTMGVRVHALNVEKCTYTETAYRLLEIMSFRLLKIWLYPDFIFNQTHEGKVFANGMKYVNSFTDNVIKEIRLKLQDTDAGIENEKQVNFAKLVIKLAENEASYTDKTIRDEISTMIITGYETTTNLLSFAAFVFANYPEVQDKVYEELHTIFGDAGPSATSMTLQHLNSMQYLERVLKEILRLFPGIVFLARRLSTAIDLGDYNLPAGSSVMVSIYKVHRCEDYWPEPLVFNPDRFLPGHPMAARHPNAYIPFSMGARNCIGRRYAIMSAKTVLSNLLWRYVIKTRKRQTVADVKLKVDVTLKPVDPIEVYITGRPSVHKQ